jgi:threonine 3-dehydrogenase
MEGHVSGPTMRALVKSKREPGIWMGEEPVPTAGPNDIIVKIEKTAICGTDMHIYEWDAWAQKTIPVPMIIGHEFSGTIAELGANVSDFCVGQRVSGEGHIVGTSSRNARAGRFHLDPATQGVGVNRPGAFADYLSIPAFNVVALPEEISPEVAAILDPLGNAIHAALSFDLVGEDVLITGAGPIGTLAAIVCRFAGARQVVITDINDYRLELAAKLTDARPVNVEREDLPDIMNELGIREGFDVGLEMSGAGNALSQMVKHMVMGGKIALLGIPSGRIEFDWQSVILKALTLKGIYGREMFETWYKALAMLQSGLQIDSIITHRYGVEDFAAAFELMLSGRSGKIVLSWD